MGASFRELGGIFSRSTRQSVASVRRVNDLPDAPHQQTGAKSSCAPACMECGGAIDAAFSVPGYCFVCSVHVASCCADSLDADA